MQCHRHSLLLRELLQAVAIAASYAEDSRDTALKTLTEVLSDHNATPQDWAQHLGLYARRGRFVRETGTGFGQGRQQARLRLAAGQKVEDLGQGSASTSLAR